MTAAEQSQSRSFGLPETVIELVDRAGHMDPERPALIWEDGLVVSRGELLERSEQFAGYLKEVTTPGDMIAAMTANRTEFMIAWFATLATGCVFVALNPEAGEHDLAHVLSDSGATLVICDPPSAEVLERVDASLGDQFKLLILTDPEPGGLDAWCGSAPLRFADAKVDPTAVTNVYYTSGTTGPPKGCMVGHLYWCRKVQAYLQKFTMDSDDRILCCLKFFYNDPTWELLTSLHVGAALVVMRKFSVSRYWNVVRDNGVTQLFTIGSIPALLLTAPPSPLDRTHGVRFGIQVAVDASLHREMTERWGIPWMDAYGLTETGGLISMPIADVERMTGSGAIGVPYPDVEARLVDDNGEESAVGAPGELMVRAPNIMTGYLNRPDATAEAIDSDGWFHTGDIMRRDEDGWFYFVGRKKDIIRRGGENIAAGELEELLRSHPDVIDAAAVPVEDPLRGEEVLAHVYTASEQTSDELAAALTDFCAASVAPYKVPRYLLFRRDDFPRTASMRVAKRQLPRGRVPAEAWDREKGH